MSKEQREMMEDPDKRLGEARNSPLTYLFRKILKDWPTGNGPDDKGVEAKVWNDRLTRFLKSPLSHCPKNPKDIGQERNNFNRAISKPEITFKTFLKAIMILGPLRYSMSIKFQLRNGREIEFSTPMSTNPYARMDELSAAVSNKGMTPAHDIDISDDDLDDVSTDQVGDAIRQIQIPDHDHPSRS